MPTPSEIYYGVAGTVAGSLITLFFTHRLTLSRERQRDRERAVDAAIKTKADRRRAFFDLVSEIKGRVSYSGDPGDWVANFIDAYLPALASEWGKISRELPQSDMEKIEPVLGELMKYANRNGYSQAYEDQGKIIENLDKLSRM